MSKKDAASVLDRLQHAYGAKDDSELALMMGQKRSTVGNWRGRGTIPYTDCVKTAEEKNLSLDWLLTGEGPMFRGATETFQKDRPENPREQALLALWRDLDEEQQRDIQRNAEEKKRLTDLETRIRELEAVVADSKKLA